MPEYKVTLTDTYTARSPRNAAIKMLDSISDNQSGQWPLITVRNLDTGEETDIDLNEE